MFKAYVQQQALLYYETKSQIYLTGKIIKQSKW